MGLFDGFRLFQGFGSRSRSGKLPGKPSRNNTSVISQLYANNKITEIDYNENNYDLFRSIYYNSTVNGLGADYQIAAALGKPIVDISAGYVLGKGFTIELDNPEGSTLVSQCEDSINQWLADNMKFFVDIARHGYRDGDAYLHIDEFGNLKEYDAKGVDEIIDPITGRTVGFDVKRRVQETDTYGNTPKNVIYVKQYRTDSIRIYKYDEGHEDTIDIIWEKMITVDGYKDIPKDENGMVENIDPDYLTERTLPIIALHNEPEAEAVYGNSDYQNLLSLFANYSGTIKSATKGAKYNAVPTLKIRGLSNPSQTEKYVENEPQGRSIAAQAVDAESAAMYGKSEDNKEGIEWGSDSVLYLSKDSDADFIRGTGFMDDIGKLLEYYFYLFVQGSETPEYVFGTAVSSSKASTSTQAPVFTKKIERKQLEFQHFIQTVVEAFVERKALMSDFSFQQLMEEMPSVRVIFPPIDDEDATLTLSTVQWAFESGMLTSEKAVELILGNRVKDANEEVKEAASEAKERAEAEPANSDRIISALLAQSSTSSEGSGGEEQIENNSE